MTDLDNDADAIEQEKNAPMPFIKPKARNSCIIIIIIIHSYNLLVMSHYKDDIVVIK